MQRGFRLHVAVIVVLVQFVKQCQLVVKEIVTVAVTIAVVRQQQQPRMPGQEFGRPDILVIVVVNLGGFQQFQFVRRQQLVHLTEIGRQEVILFVVPFQMLVEHGERRVVIIAGILIGAARVVTVQKVAVLQVVVHNVVRIVRMIDNDGGIRHCVMVAARLVVMNVMVRRVGRCGILVLVVLLVVQQGRGRIGLVIIKSIRQDGAKHGFGNNDLWFQSVFFLHNLSHMKQFQRGLAVQQGRSGQVLGLLFLRGGLFQIHDAAGGTVSRILVVGRTVLTVVRIFRHGRQNLVRRRHAGVAVVAIIAVGSSRRQIVVKLTILRRGPIFQFVQGIVILRAIVHTARHGRGAARVGVHRGRGRLVVIIVAPPQALQEFGTAPATATIGILTAGGAVDAARFAAGGGGIAVGFAILVLLFAQPAKQAVGTGGPIRSHAVLSIVLVVVVIVQGHRFGWNDHGGGGGRAHFGLFCLWKKGF
mmetsp:Transcript_29073/g.79795  ORF Transcript_29073/g.79795 Transcript_29073/m.79795 type:complete len:474 (+) Transcript_29073:613-2034(+)